MRVKDPWKLNNEEKLVKITKYKDGTLKILLEKKELKQVIKY